MPTGIQPIEEKKKPGLLEAIATAGSIGGTLASVYDGGSKLLDKFTAPPDLGDPGFDKLPAQEQTLQSQPATVAFLRRQKEMRGLA